MLGGLRRRPAPPARSTVGVLIPGSKSDKGWMESGYDGLKAAEKKLGAKIKVKFIENVKFADMEQALVTLAGKNELVIGVGGQTQASVFKVAPALPQGEVRHHRRQRATREARQRLGLRRAPGRDRLRGRRGGGHAVQDRRVSAMSAAWRSRPS